jgi:hypothetical protein
MSLVGDVIMILEAVTVPPAVTLPVVVTLEAETLVAETLVALAVPATDKFPPVLKSLPADNVPATAVLPFFKTIKASEYCVEGGTYPLDTVVT